MTAQEDTVESDTPQSLLRLREFLKLPIEERRRILAEQAEQMVEHYEEESARLERELWQGGDIIEY
jgi:hypothetical protein